MTSKKSPAERLDAFSAWVFDDDGADAQLAAMREFIPAAREQLNELRARIVPAAEDCDKASLELAGLYEHYAGVRDLARETRNALGGINDELRDLTEPVKTAQAQARLDAFGINEVTKKPYTVKQTDDRAVVALSTNEQYQALVKRQRQLEGEKAGALAVLADCETALSEYRNRNRALVAELENLTARLGG